MGYDTLRSDVCSGLCVLEGGVKNAIQYIQLCRSWGKPPVFKIPNCVGWKTTKRVKLYLREFTLRGTNANKFRTTFGTQGAMARLEWRILALRCGGGCG